MLLEEYDGSKEPKCAQLLRKERSGGARGGADYYCDLGAKSRKGASLNKGLPWLPYSSELWVVNHFSRDRRSAAKSPGRWTRLVFDFRAAEREIRAKKALINAVFMRTRLDEGVYEEPFRSELEEALKGGTPNAEPMSRLRERSITEGHQTADEGGEASAPAVTAVELPDATASARACMSVSGQPIVRGGYEGMRCAGCGHTFGKRSASTCCRGAGCENFFSVAKPLG